LSARELEGMDTASAVYTVHSAQNMDTLRSPLHSVLIIIGRTDYK